MQSGYLPFDGSNIHYLKWGAGEKVLICFHGYGEAAQNFNFLAQKLHEEFTLVAIDLPYHGETKWNSGPLSNKQLEKIILEILRKEDLPLVNLYVLGFSLGGRIALSLYQQIPAQIKRIVLLAPDGLKMNFWYWVSTQTLIGNSLFKWTMASPGWFFGMLKIGNRIQFINRSIYKFVEYYIHDDDVRRELYDRWTCLRKCKPNIAHIRNHIATYQSTVRLLYGKHDRIILTSPAKRFIDELKTAKIEVLDCGHQVLHGKNSDQIVNALIS